jgi:hypothetical protein
MATGDVNVYSRTYTNSERASERETDRMHDA